jgi:hypothetical protein
MDEQLTNELQGVNMPQQGMAQESVAIPLGQNSAEPQPNGAPVDPAMQGGASPVDEMRQHLAQLPDEQKAYLADIMTPEVATAFGIVLGDEAYQYFSSIADTTKVLVPVPRSEVEAANTQPQAPAQGPLPQDPTQSRPPSLPQASPN